MSFAFQSFGLGEFFKAQQRIEEILEEYFIGVLEAPSCYLDLGRSLQQLKDGIDRLLDENSNRNSAILRPDNKLAAQQMLRVASHGLIGVLDDFEKLLRGFEEDISNLKWDHSTIARARVGQAERSWTVFKEKFTFQAWKLELLFRCLRRSNISETLKVKEQANTAVRMLFEPSNNASETPTGNTSGTSIKSSELLLGLSIPDITRRLQESCQFGSGSKFFWKLKPETTILIVLHWTHRAKLGLRYLNITAKAPLDARVNLIKAAWVIKSCCANSGSEAFYTEEFRTILTLLACEVLYMFRQVWDKEGTRTEPEPYYQASHGDYTVFIDESDSSSSGRSNAATSPAQSSSSLNAYGNMGRHGHPLNEYPVSAVGRARADSQILPPDSPTFLHEEDEISILDQRRFSGLARPRPAGGIYARVPQNMDEHSYAASVVDAETIHTDSSNTSTYCSSTYSQSTENHSAPTMSTGGSSASQLGKPARSLSENTLHREYSLTATSHQRPDLQPPFSPVSPISPINPTHIARVPLRARERAVTTGTMPKTPQPPSSSGSGTSSLREGTGKEVAYISQGKEVISGPSQPYSEYESAQQGQRPFLPGGPSGYSWNEKVDVQALGVRPGETEVMAKELQSMKLKASYTGDMHGRWDSCRVRVFRDTGDTNMKLRILTVQEGTEESVDQQFVDSREGELVPEYAYHEMHPVIYIRKTRPKVAALSGTTALSSTTLYYKFKDLHDMFTFQLAFLGESVEADCSAVRTIRYKRSILDGEHNHYKARIQIWHEQDQDHEVRSSAASYAPTIASRVRAQSNIKVHSTRIVMYWEESITILFVTDSIELETSRRTKILRIRPSSHRAFNNPTTVKAKTIGTRELSGAFPLDKRGLLIDDETNFDDYKWFDIDFLNTEDMNIFYQEFQHALKERRKERRHAEELQRLAERGVRAGAQIHYANSNLGRR